MFGMIYVSNKDHVVFPKHRACYPISYIVLLTTIRHTRCVSIPTPFGSKGGEHVCAPTQG